MSYQGYLTKESRPFNPIELAKETAKIVCDGNRRKYTEFYCTGVYGGISTGYLVGCDLRCFFCWVNKSRDYPEKYGEFCSPAQVFSFLYSNARKGKVKRLRISGGEPTLCKKHLLGLLELVENINYLFILETNGLLINKEFAKELSEFKNIHVRVSLKAGTPEGFQKRTGALAKFYELPYRSIKNLLDNNVSMHVASMSDPRLMPKKEREAMIVKLYKIDRRIALELEEELCDPYPNTKERLKFAGIELKGPAG